MRFCIRFILIFIHFLPFAFADSLSLETLLDIDRFHAYLNRWVNVKNLNGQIALASAVKNLSVEEIQKLNLPAAALSDVDRYDGIILRYLNEKYPALPATRENVKWDSPKIKARLQNAYRIEFEDGQTALPQTSVSQSLSGNQIKTPNEKLLFDVDRYTSDRVGRAPLWDAAQRGLPVEIHIGDTDGFRRNISERGGQIIARVRGGPHRYSEPMFVVKLPGEESYRYAIADVQGADRVRHFELQSSHTHWRNSPPPRTEVIGDIAKDLKREQGALTLRLMALPPVDKVVIGYIDSVKDALEVQANAVALRELLKKAPESLIALATEEERTLLARFESSLPLSSTELFENKKIIKTFTARVKGLFATHQVPAPESIVIAEHATRSGRFVDLRVRGNGEEKIWRVFSNVWGDQILPIARALKATGVRDITYIGTAGAVGDTHSLGDLVVPENAITPEGLKPFLGHSLPEGARRVFSVAFVPTPLEETVGWEAKNTASIVEVETRYLAEVFNQPGDRVRPYLVVSDLIGKEGQSISDVGVAFRSRGRNMAMGLLMDEASISETIPVGRCKTPRCQCLIRSFNALVGP